MSKVIASLRVEGNPQIFSTVFILALSDVVNIHIHAKIHLSSTNRLEGKSRTAGRTERNYKGSET